MTLRIFATLALAFLIVGGAAAQPADSTGVISDECSGANFRAFDFWLGRWVVRDSTGKRVGSSHISRVARGCAIRESWTGRSGSRGVSLNYYDAEDDAWHQDWVGGRGLILHLTGTRTDRTMTLEGTRMTDDGPIRDRIRWQPLEDGRVRQEWTISSDDGATRKRVFLGFYEPASNAGTDG